MSWSLCLHEFCSLRCDSSRRWTRSENNSGNFQNVSPGCATLLTLRVEEAARVQAGPDVAFPHFTGPRYLASIPSSPARLCLSSLSCVFRPTMVASGLNAFSLFLVLLFPKQCTEQLFIEHLHHIRHYEEFRGGLKFMGGWVKVTCIYCFM